MSFDKNASNNRPTVIRSQIYSAVIGYKPINNSAKVNRIGYREHELDNTSEFQCFDVLLDIFRRLSTRFVAQHSHVMRSYFSSLARQAAPITQFLAAVDTEDGRMDELLVRRTNFARLRPCLRMLAVNQSLQVKIDSQVLETILWNREFLPAQWTLCCVAGTFVLEVTLKAAETKRVQARQGSWTLKIFEAYWASYDFVQWASYDFVYSSHHQRI